MSHIQRKKRRERMMLLASMGVTLAAALILALAFWMFAGGKNEEETEETLQEIPEDPMEALEPEEEGAEIQISTVKEIESETDDITLGVDVSKFQENINWNEVAESGIDYAMVRVGYRTAQSGELKEDECARYNLQEADAAGVHLGAYFFSTAVNEEEVREEAAWVCDFLSGYPITYPVVYNCEGFQNESSRQHGLSNEERSKLARIFLEQVEEAGYTGMFYASRSELENNLFWDTDMLESKYRIWVAQYSELTYPEVSAPDYDGKYVMWQYTDKGTVPGIRTVVDLNVAYFGYSETAAAMQEGAAGHVEYDPEVGVNFEEVSEQVTSKDATNLRSSMEQGDDSNVVAQLKNGETALRTGKGGNGWSRLEYDGKVVYAVSSYLTTDLDYKPPVEEPDDGFKTKFTAVTENVTAKEVTNLRNRPSVEEPSEVIVQLHNGEVIARTGVSELGWSRVEYNGQTLYCISSYLQTVE